MNNTGVFSSAQTTGSARTAQQQIHYTTAAARERLSRYWMARLKGSEFKVLSFVLERTLPFGKQKEIIPIRHFTDGVWSRTGAMVTAGTGLSRRSVIYALGALLEHGLIMRWESRPTEGHVQDAYWFALDFKNLWGEGGMLRVPKRLREPRATKLGDAEEFEGGGCKKRNRGVQKLRTEAMDVEAMEKSPVLRTGVAAATTAGAKLQPLADLAATVQARARARREEKAKKAEVKLTLPLFNKVWEAEHVQHFPRVPTNAISVRGFAIIRSAMKTYRLSVPFRDFVSWFFENYESQRHSKRFAWIKKNADLEPLPAVPTPDTLVRYYKHFVAAFEATVQAGYNERAVDWKQRADEAQAREKAKSKDVERLAALVEEQRSVIAALERDKRSLQQKKAPVSQIDLDDELPKRRRPLDADPEFGAWGKKR